jgi:hypothetical protein
VRAAGRERSGAAVTAVLGAVMLASLLMAAAIPGRSGTTASYVVLRVGRNAAAVSLLARDHRLRASS